MTKFVGNFLILLCVLFTLLVFAGAMLSSIDREMKVQAARELLTEDPSAAIHLMVSEGISPAEIAELAE